MFVSFADNFTGAIIHPAARNTAFAVVSKAPPAKLEAFKKRMGWTFPWYSSFGNSFNHDFQVTVDEAAGSDEYNYEKAAKLKQARKIWIEEGGLPGLSVFLRDGDTSFTRTPVTSAGLICS